ncbi:hypothetical protein M426DRAFT_20577 [Hypoxylon sp. CI-4A]|nr:hypothetical protein M426DRAFT_20577 [Hypoxylon sp. CI-4A]
MASNNNTEYKKEFFKWLKPRCIAVNTFVNTFLMRPSPPAVNTERIGLGNVLNDLHEFLVQELNEHPDILDLGLTNYVFYPISRIFKKSHEFSNRVIELTIKCLKVLIDYGWKSGIPASHAEQLLVFLTFVIGGVPGRQRNGPVPEETELISLQTLASLIAATGSSLAGSASLVKTETIPALGHTVTVILDAIVGGRTPDIQLAALGALDALLVAIRDQVALATFIPGIVSALSKLLTPPSSQKYQRKVLVGGINSLKGILTRVLGDIKVMSIMKKPTPEHSEESTEGKVLTHTWLKATAGKVKLALAGVLKLRNIDSEDVRSALEKLCVTLLDECHESLADCASILVESAMILSNEENEESTNETGLTELARIYPELGDTIKTTVYNWVTSLPRIVQSSDDQIKQRAIRNLIKGQYFITTLQIDSPILADSLAASLRDTSTALIIASKQSNFSEITSSAIELNMDVVKPDGPDVFPPVLISEATERPTRTALLELLSRIGSISQQGKLANDLLSYVRESTGPSQVATYWLTFELIKASFSQSSDLDEFLDLSSAGEATEDNEGVFQELYTFSTTVLDSQADADEVDWRLQALALEVTTFAAARTKEGFRPELIDVLYPITTFLGSEVPKLREHAIISLNDIAASCGYANVTDLIIDNVDYMVNSISLRLNTFNISPASTQVLRMMIKLTGPKLIPYLDDIIASIFAALDNYHGYPILVESLFSVLTEVVQQGSQSSHLFLEEGKSSAIDHKKNQQPTVEVEEIREIFAARTERREKRRVEDLKHDKAKSHPKQPWKAKKPVEAEGEADQDAEEPTGEVEKEPPPKTPTFKILARITDLTQHYLTSPTPSLRKSLLDLLATVCPALSPDEDAFLPLVNSIWPVLIERLYDSEPFVVISACKTTSVLCQTAGDFLNTRIKTEWWDNLGKWCKKVKADASSRAKQSSKTANRDGNTLLIPIRSRDGIEGKESSKAVEVASSGSGLGRFTQAAQVWEAVQGLLVAIVSYVQIDDDVFDQILTLLADSLATNPEAKAALEAVDPDAVWLAMHERGMVEPMQKPVLDGIEFAEM